VGRTRLTGIRSRSIRQTTGDTYREDLQDGLFRERQKILATYRNQNTDHYSWFDMLCAVLAMGPKFVEKQQGFNYSRTHVEPLELNISPIYFAVSELQYKLTQGRPDLPPGFCELGEFGAEVRARSFLENYLPDRVARNA
jgi:hypothetical protein